MHLFPSKGHNLFHVVQFAAMPVSPPFEISGYGPVAITILENARVALVGRASEVLECGSAFKRPRIQFKRPRV